MCIEAWHTAVLQRATGTQMAICIRAAERSVFFLLGARNTSHGPSWITFGAFARARIDLLSLPHVLSSPTVLASPFIGKYSAQFYLSTLRSNDRDHLALLLPPGGPLLTLLKTELRHSSGSMI